MKHIFSSGRFRLLTAGLLLLAAPIARAQAPVWQMATTAVREGIAPSSSTVNATAVDAADNVYIAGEFEGTLRFGTTLLTSAPGNNGFVAKWNPVSGSFAWASRVGGPVAAVAVAGTGVFIAGGFAGTAAFGGTSLVGSADGDGFVAKLTDGGTTANYAWATRLGGNDADQATAIALEGSNVYVAGYFSSAVSLGTTLLISAGSRDAFVAQLTDTGNAGAVAWARQMGGTGTDGAVALGVNGPNIYVAGNATGTASFGTATLTSGTVYPAFAFVAKLTGTGGFGWVQQGIGSVAASALATNGADVYMAGGFSGTATFGGVAITGSSADLFVAKLTDAGNTASFIWAQGAGGFFNEDVARTVATRGANVYVGGVFTDRATFGASQLVGSGNDVFVAKLLDSGATGAWVWAQQAGGSTSQYDRASGLAVSSSGTVYVGGTVGPPASFGGLTITGSGPIIGFLASLTDQTLTGTAPAGASERLALFPNPAHGTATVQLPAVPGAATATLTVIDALGRPVRTFRAAPNALAELDLAGLPAGLYAVRVQAGGSTATRRLVVE
ncbi:MAG: hypothetical protein JWP58_770 [Hymenobacter sp.]|nr:hypothetical protein [Hymenobacter sp.]